jgi:hypothetical protein
MTSIERFGYLIQLLFFLAGFIGILYLIFSLRKSK